MLAQALDNLQKSISPDESTPVWVHIKYRTQYTQEVEARDGLAMAQTIRNALEELGFARNAESNTWRKTADLEEWIEQFLKRVGFGICKAFEHGLERVSLDQEVLDARRLVLQPEYAYVNPQRIGDWVM
jgi:hypothetical protein